MVVVWVLRSGSCRSKGSPVISGDWSQLLLDRGIAMDGGPATGVRVLQMTRQGMPRIRDAARSSGSRSKLRLENGPFRDNAKVVWCLAGLRLTGCLTTCLGSNVSLLSPQYSF